MLSTRGWISFWSVRLHFKRWHMKPKIIRKPSTHSSKNGVPSSLGADRQGERIMAETNSGAAAAIESLDPRIRYTLHGGVATITIAQPEKRNEIGRASCRERVWQYV